MSKVALPVPACPEFSGIFRDTVLRGLTLPGCGIKKTDTIQI